MDCEPLLPLALLFSLQTHWGAKYFSFAGHCIPQPSFQVNQVFPPAVTVPFPNGSVTGRLSFLLLFLHRKVFCVEKLNTCSSIFCFQGEKVLQNDEFTRDLFRFLQLLCEGHNSGKWNRLICQRKTTFRCQIMIQLRMPHLIEPAVG